MLWLSNRYQNLCFILGGTAIIYFAIFIKQIVIISLPPCIYKLFSAYVYADPGMPYSYRKEEQNKTVSKVRKQDFNDVD